MGRTDCGSAAFARAAAMLWVLLGAPAADAQWVLSGAVVDAEGNGVAGVDIDIVSASSGTELDLTGDVTDTAGLFALETLVTPLVGFYDIIFKPAAGTNFLDLVAPDVFLGGDTELGTFELVTAFTVSGRVVDDGGDGLAGIDLELISLAGEPYDLTNDDTDAAGGFSVVIPEGVWNLKFREVTTGSASLVPVLLENLAVDMDLDLGDVVLHTGHSVTGIVEDSAGDPVQGADVDVRDPLTGVKIETDSDNADSTGRFEVLVPAGDWSFEVDAPVGVLLAPAAFPFTVEPPPAGNDMGTLVLEDGIAITGKVVDDAGDPIAGVDLDLALSATGAAVVTTRDDTDANGDFLVIVAPDTYDLFFRPAFSTGKAPALLGDVDASESTDVGEVTLEDGYALSGTVTDGSGDPVAGVVVTLADAGTGAAVPVFGNKTDALGNYALRQVGDVYDVTFTPPAATGLDPVVVAGVDLTSDTLLDIEVSDGTPPTPGSFRRGDADGNGSVLALIDGLFLLVWGFSDGPEPPCLDAADANNNGSVSALLDALYVLQWAFTSGPAPPSPGTATCGPDPEGLSDGVGCDTSPAICD